MTKELNDSAAAREIPPPRGTRWGEGLWSIVRELNRRGLEPARRPQQPSELEAGWTRLQRMAALGEATV